MKKAMQSLARLAACMMLPLVFAGQSFGGAADDGTALRARGEGLLNKLCSRCHAIGREGKSTHAEAPAFRDVMKRYPAENIAEALAEGLVSGHPDMPEFTFEPDEVDAIVGYLDSLREGAAK